MIKGLAHRISHTTTYSPIPLAEHTQDITSKKSYKDTWKRALKAIKRRKYLQRFSEVHDDHPYLVTPEVLMYHLSHLNLRNEQAIRISFPRFMIVPYGKIYITWSIVNLISLLYLSTIGIYIATFYNDNEIPSRAIGMEFAIDLIFMIDLLINFDLAYFNYDNKLITAYKEIWVNYLKSRFLFDLFTSFPVGYILRSIYVNDVPSFYLMRFIPKFLRWLGIRHNTKPLYFLKSFDKFVLQNRHFYELSTVTVSALIGLHLMACLFFLSAKYEDFSTHSWVTQLAMNDLSAFEQYISSLYWAFETLTSIGFGEIHAYTPLEKSFAMFVMALGVFLWSFTSSLFFIALSRMVNSDIIIRENLNFADDFCKISGVPYSIKRRFKHCIKDKKIMIKNISIDKIIDPHNMDLRYSVAMDIYNKALTKINFFIDKKKSFIAHFAFHLVMIQYTIDELLWVKGSYADGIYFIFDGRVKLYYKGIIFHIIREGSYVGDLEIFMKSERQFDVHAGDVTKCMKLSVDRLKELQEDYPDYYMELKEECEERMQKIVNDISLMISLKLYHSKDIASFNDSVCSDIKRRMFYKMFSDNFYAMRNKKILDIIHLNKEFLVYKKRVKNILRLIANKHNVKL